MIKIAIDAGHGKYTAGKRCLKSLDPKETREWVLNSRIADKLQALLKDYECEVRRVDDITGETDVSLGNRCKAANNWGADFYLSVHHNAGVNGGKGGGVVIYTHPNTKQSTHTIRDIIYAEVIKENKLKGNRYDGTLTANFQVLRDTKMPAVLIECGFMDSSVDTPQILTEEFATKTANGLCNGLVKSLNLKAKEVAKETNVPIKKEETKENTVSDWAKEEMAEAIKRGITDGTRPQEPATREEVAVMIVRALKG